MPKILIVDDEWLTRLEIEEMLTDRGYDVAGQAETGTEAVAMARELNPDLIFMDVEMPGEMNGIDAARVIKAELGTPIVFVSGHDDPEHIEAAKEIAPFGYVMKPFDEREIHAFVEIALSKRKLELKLEEAHDELERRVESRTAELEEANKQLQEENEAHKRTEKALRESEEHLRSFMESAKGFIVYRLEVDFENYFSGRLVFVSPGIEDEIGVSPEAEFSEWFKSVHPDDLPGLIEAQAESVQNGDTFDREFRWKNLKGGWEWCHAISNPVLDSEGKPKYYNGMIIIVTAQKQAEKSLQESEGHLRSLMDTASNFAVYRLISHIDNPDLLRVIFVSPSITDIMGVSEQMSFETWFERIHPDDVERIVRANIEAFKTLRFDETMRIYHPQKQKWIWIHAVSTGFEDQEHQCLYVNGILIDVTREKEIEEAQRDSEKRLNAILDATTETIVLFDRNGIVHVANQIVCERLKTSKEEFVGKRIYDFFPPDVAERRKQKWKEVFDTGKPVNFEDSRNSMTFEQRAYPVLDEEGQVQMVVAFANNKTDRRLAEEALRESEEHHRSFMESAKGFVVYRLKIDPKDYHKGHVVFVSPSLKDIIGASPQEEFREWFKNIHEDDLPSLINAQNESAQSGVPLDQEFRLKGLGGEWRWLHVISNPVFDSEGKPEYYNGITIDITEQKQATQALQEKERFHEGLLNDMITFVAVLDPSGDVIFVNNTPLKVGGIKLEDIRGKKFFDAFWWTHSDEVREMIKRDIEQCASGESIVHDVPIQTADGSLMWIEFSMHPIHDEYGVVQYLIPEGRDITANKGAEEALRESEKKYRRLVENALVGVYQVEKSGKFIMANERMAEIFGYDSAGSLISSVGSVANLYARSEDRPVVLADIEVKGAVYGRNVEFRKKDGEIVWIKLHTRVVREDEKTIYEGLMEDLTESKRAEEERTKLEEKLARSRKMEAIGTLAGGVAHDLNNILGGLVSYPELLLLQLPEDSPLRKSILTIQKSGEKAAAVVQDLLTLARRGVVVTEVVNLNDVIADQLKSPENEKLQLYHPGVNIDSHLEKDTLNILGSSTHLSKTVMNLVSNAAEAMPERGEISISTENRYVDRPIGGYDNVKEGDYVVLVISDTGTGISPDDMEKIFEPFYTKKKMGKSGTGLGMAVVWGTVKDHNGYIDVQSTEGKGTTFTLYFPVTREKLPKDKSHLAIGSYSGDGESILVIDDVEEQRNIASGMLKELGYSVAMVSSGEEAVEYLKTNKADLLLLDMIMAPGMDGLDTYRKILEIHPGQKAIIASGFSETDRVKAIQGLGSGAYIRKPFLLERIGIAVKKELDKSEARSL